MEAKIRTCEDILGFPIPNDSELRLVEALNMSGQGVGYRGQWLQVPKNDRLAVYGELVAQNYLCDRWYRTQLTKGNWNQIREDILGNKNLARVGYEKGLQHCLNLNPGTSTVSEDMRATAVKAILGAVYRSGGETALATVMDRLGLTSELMGLRNPHAKKSTAAGF